MIGLTRHFVREMNTFLSGPTIPWMGIGKEFWRGRRDQVPQGFSKPSAINGFDVPLPTTV